ncbi:MAG TPA: ABC transporter permease, partial [Aggregatilineales bacterium]|nr:ABC transporter permease [Aggregatilineales bacterium]
IAFYGAQGIESGAETVLTFETGAVEDVLHITVPSQAFIIFVALIFVIGGAFGTYTSQNEEQEQWGRYALIFCGILIIPVTLIAAAAGDRTNAITVLSESLRLATPIAIGAMAGLWCERSGVVNIAIEGMMLFGACFGFTTLFLLRQEFGVTNWLLAVSVGVAILSGGIASLVHAWLSITFKTDQIVSGTVINILALGTTSFVRREYLLSTEAGTETLPSIAIPVLSKIPIIGDLLFVNKPIFYLMFVILVLSHIVLFHTRWGLRTRAVGENPHAADTVGVNVFRIRWTNVFIGGMIAGLAGAWFSLETIGRFNDGMTSDRGFIALAALIFGKWTPAGAFTGALLFGFSDALGTRLQLLDVNVPEQFLQMVPYLTTII